MDYCRECGFVEIYNLSEAIYFKYARGYRRSSVYFYYSHMYGTLHIYIEYKSFSVDTKDNIFVISRSVKRFNCAFEIFEVLGTLLYRLD